MFTLPALIFLGFGSEFTFWRIFPLALLGGWLGVLFMIAAAAIDCQGNTGILLFLRGRLVRMFWWLGSAAGRLLGGFFGVSGLAAFIPSA